MDLDSFLTIPSIYKILILFYFISPKGVRYCNKPPNFYKQQKYVPDKLITFLLCGLYKKISFIFCLFVS